MAATSSSTRRSENAFHEITPFASSSTTSSSTGRSENAFHEITPFVSSSTTLRQRPYDVFINHRGPDVKLNLASPIYHFLDLVGVNAFFDREELDLGNLVPQAIDNAMRSALIHIAIFSKDYAASPWCLAELSFMLETEAPIIPVFYDVEPADLKWGASKLYNEAFSKHETSRRYKAETLEKWKRALHLASSLNGYLFKSNGDVGILLKEIVNCVQQEIKNVKVPFKVATYPVGLDDAVRDFDGFIGSAGVHQGVQIVGIVGMGGCGKTTLARELYNRKCKAFDYCSFLSEVTEAALPDLQKKLLEDLLHLRGIPFKDASEGSSILAGRLKASSSRRVLIVLDDVHHVDHLNALLPEKDRSLGSGSLIIVTTRDSGVLSKWDVSLVYQMTPLERRHAKKLFCWHAFKEVSPPAAFEGLVQEFITACNGLPLSLKVIAEMLYGKSEEYWKSNLKKISSLLPTEITKRLRLSYDALDEEEKNIFLDVACFFVGEKKNLAIAVWDAAEWNGLQNFENLENKCLVEVDKQNRIRMHAHLRDLGRQIAFDCAPYRLWEERQIRRYTQQRIVIRGIMAAATKFNACPVHDEFPECCALYPPPSEKCMDLKYLKLLVVAREYFTSEIAELSEALVWLRLFEFQDTNLPSWLSLTNLRVLELYGASSLQQLWENNAQPPKELREMIITATEGNSFDSFPSNISGLKHLTKIALISYNGKEFLFTSLPDEFCDLQSLEHLELCHCNELSTLPPRFGELANLRHLDLCSCQKLRRLPVSFKKLVNLEYLDLSGCEKLPPMQDILENMTKLEKLDFSGHAKLKELPLHIAKQKFLRELHLKKTELMVVPNNIDQLSKLETLVIGSPHLTGFPKSLGNLSSLTRLKITGCIKLESLPESVKCLKLLEYLFIKSAENMWSLPEGLRQLTNLQILKIFDCPIAKLDFGSGSSSSLGKLKVIHLKATDVTRLSISQDCCPNLETLQLDQNSRLMGIDILSTSVKKVKVSDCTMLRNINGIRPLVNPETFEITLKHKRD